MTDVVIVSRPYLMVAATVACPRSTPPTCWPPSCGIVDRWHRPTGGSIVTGCVSQVGEQSFNVGRGLAHRRAAHHAGHHVDTQCGSSQQATNLATSLIASGVVDVAVACGVELMSRVPIGSNSSKKLGLGVPIPKTYFGRYEFTSQFEGAERIADKWGITRADTDEFGLLSQQRAAPRGRGPLRLPGHAGRRPDVDEEGNPPAPPTGSSDEGLRETSLEALANLSRSPAERRAHRRQLVADQRRRLGRADDDRPKGPGARPAARARVVDTCLVGVDPCSCSPVPSTPPGCSSAPACRSTTSTCSRSTRPSPGRAGLAARWAPT